MSYLFNFISRWRITLNCFARISIIIFCVTLTPLFQSCSISLLGNNSDESSSDNYTYKFPTQAWIEIPKDRSDMALMNKDFGSIITISSTCKKYITASLKNLANNIYTGVTDIIVIDEKEIQLFGRQTLKKQITGKLDGINVSLLSYTLIKNKCIYDFILIHPQITIPEQIIKDMDNFINTVTIN